MIFPQEDDNKNYKQDYYAKVDITDTDRNKSGSQEEIMLEDEDYDKNAKS